LNPWRAEGDHRAGSRTVDRPPGAPPAERDIMAFQKVTRAEFDGIIAGSGSEAFQRLVGRYDIALKSHEPDDCVVHRGSLSAAKLLQAPAFATIVHGDVTVDGLVDLGNPEGFDEGGLFLVFGNVTCCAFAGTYAKCAFIDGNLVARDLILNSFEDSALVITGSLRTRFFYGQDIWAEVGGSAEMEFGDGYCLPIGYTEAVAQVIEPRHDRDASLRRLDFEDTDYIEPQAFLERLRSGQSVFS
jgi:hypothetical protein